MEGRVCGALSLSRAFGDYQYKESDMVISEPEILVFKRRDTDMVLVACDGIWEHCQQDYGEGVTEGVYRSVYKQGLSGKEALRKLMDTLIAKTMNQETTFGLDNMSCILVRLKQSGGIQRPKIRKSKK